MATIIDPSISYIINNNLVQYHDLFVKCCRRTSEFPKGAILSKSGDPIPYMYFLLEGMVKIYTMNPSGYVRILGYHKSNTLFAMDGICGAQEPAVVTVESITPVKVLLVTWDDIVEMGNEDHSFPSALLRYYITARFSALCALMRKQKAFAMLPQDWRPFFVFMKGTQKKTALSALPKTSLLLR